MLLGCGQSHSSGHAALVNFDALVANPQQYAGQYLCTAGVHVVGFEISGLAASIQEKDGYPQLAEPVVWLEGADLRSREDCVQFDTQPPFEFCQAVVCGTFETGGGYGHGGGYAYQLRGRGVSALPSPTATPAPAASASPTNETASERNPVEEAPEVAPPPAILEISGQEQVSGIGTHCWQRATGTDTAVGVCADMAGIPTAEEPLVVSSPFTATFRLAPEETPYALLLEVIPVTVKDEFEEWPAGWRGWAFKEGKRYSLPLEREPSFELSLEPGLYALNLAGWWQPWGDASYGFLVEVSAPTIPIGATMHGLLAYVRDHDLWLKTLPTGPEARLTHFGDAANPHLSSDGRLILFERLGEAVPIPDESLFEYQRRAWWAVSTAGGEPYQVLDSDHLPSHVWGEAVTLTVPSLPQAWTWLSGDRTVIFTTQDVVYGVIPNDDLWHLNLETGYLDQLLPAGQGGTPTLSPNGQAVLLTSADGIAVAGVDGRNRHTLLTFEPVPTYSEVPWIPRPQWIEDGTARLSVPAFWEWGEPLTVTLWLLNPVVGDSQQLGEIQMETLQHPLWSPDGLRLAYSDGDLVLADGDGRNPRRFSKTGDVLPLAWSPTGNRLAFWWAGQLCTVEDSNGAEPACLIDTLEPRAEWLDDRHLVFLQIYHEKPTRLIVADLGSGERTLLWEGMPPSSYDLNFPLAPTPMLTVDEHAIVAAEVDGPGHFEYTDRLGEQILARIEGLRAYAAEQELARTNAALAPFGYRLETRSDAEWNRTFHDLYRDGSAQPVLAGLSHVWPVSVNASGTDFVLAAENAPNVFPLYLRVQAGSVEPWGADQSAYLPPAYVGDALARVTFTGFPTLTYQVELDNQAIYSSTTIALGAYMPLQSFTTWDGHWALEVDDHLIVDSQDLGEALGYAAAFGFSLIQGQPFYFFEQDGKVRMSYGRRTLPNVYDEVFHNQCCEAAIHNVETLGDVVLFHALWNGTWYFIEAGVDDGEMTGTYRYTAPEGWSFRYPMYWGPMHWDRLDEEQGFIQDTAIGKTVNFASSPTTQAELERWLESEIARKLAATEADNTLAEPLTTVQEGGLTIYRYAILSHLESAETLLRTTILFDGQRRYEFYAAIPPVAEEEYEAIVASFQPTGQ